MEMGPRLDAGGAAFSGAALGNLLAPIIGRLTVDGIVKYAPLTAYLLAVAIQQLCLAQYAPLPVLGKRTWRKDGWYVT